MRKFKAFLENLRAYALILVIKYLHQIPVIRGTPSHHSIFFLASDVKEIQNTTSVLYHSPHRINIYYIETKEKILFKDICWCENNYIYFRTNCCHSFSYALYSKDIYTLSGEIRFDNFPLNIFVDLFVRDYTIFIKLYLLKVLSALCACIFVGNDQFSLNFLNKSAL